MSCLERIERPDRARALRIDRKSGDEELVSLAPADCASTPRLVLDGPRAIGIGRCVEPAKVASSLSVMPRRSRGLIYRSLPGRSTEGGSVGGRSGCARRRWMRRGGLLRGASRPDAGQRRRAPRVDPHAGLPAVARMVSVKKLPERLSPPTGRTDYRGQHRPRRRRRRRSVLPIGDQPVHHRPDRRDHAHPGARCCRWSHRCSRHLLSAWYWAHAFVTSPRRLTSVGLGLRGSGGP